jgi:DNA-binding MarR family transcriptional regulator
VPEPRWLTSKQASAWRGYRRMRTLLDLQLARDLAADSGLSESDYDVLSTLTENEQAQWRASDLAARLLWSTSRLAHHVGRMERRGLVTRVPSEDDGRGALVVLTEHGWDTLRAAAPLHVASVRRHFIDLLSAEEIEVLTRLSGKVVEQLSAGS